MTKRHAQRCIFKKFLLQILKKWKSHSHLFWSWLSQLTALKCSYFMFIWYFGSLEHTRIGKFIWSLVNKIRKIENFIYWFATCCTFAIRYSISPFDIDMLYTLQSVRKILSQQHVFRHVLHNSDEENLMFSRTKLTGFTGNCGYFWKVCSLFFTCFLLFWWLVLLPIHIDP